MTEKHYQTLNIIKKVKSHPTLWKRGIISDCNEKDQVWNLISEELKINVETIKSRWEILRATFQRRLTYMKTTKTKFTTWIFFPHLLFLLPSYKKILTERIYKMDYYKKHKDLYTLYSDDEDDDGGENDDDEETTENLTPISSPKNGCLPKSIQKNQHSDKTLDFNQIDEQYIDYMLEINKSDDTPTQSNQTQSSLVQSNQKQIGSLQHNNKNLSTIDSDYIFLKSLTPFLKSLPDNRKISVIINLQQILLSEDIDYDKWTNCDTDIKTNELNLNDSNLQYLISLLPFIKAIPDYKKLKIRIKILEIFKNEQQILHCQN